MNDELKTKYPYITEDQWSKVDLGEASWIDFLTKEDLSEYQTNQLKVKKEKAVADIIANLKKAESLPSAQLIIGSAFSLQDYFFSKTGRYAGQDALHVFVQHPELRGLRIYSNSYEAPNEEKEMVHGFNITFNFIHEATGLVFTKTIPGKGNAPEDTDWQLIDNE